MDTVVLKPAPTKSAVQTAGASKVPHSVGEQGSTVDMRHV